MSIKKMYKPTAEAWHTSWARVGFCVAFAILTVMIVAHPLAAQVVGTGSIQGTVQDSSGAVVSGATVTATNPSTGLKSSQTTSATGGYVIVDLPAGDYTINVEAPGFAAFEEHVTLAAMTQMGVNIKLKVGAQTEKITVSADEAPMLETENGQVENTIPQTTYEALPINMGGAPKSPVAFLTLVPGVISPSQAEGQQVFGYTFNGGIDGSSQVYVNGLPVVSSEMQGGWENLNFNAENIDQFQVITSGVPSYYEGQGIANLVYKSGTNQFHGSVYENVRNTIFDAKAYFTPASSPTPEEHQNEYGLAGGGPVVKDRVFFFGSWDHFKITSGSAPAFVTVPTPAETQGDFSSFPFKVFDPTTTVQTSATGCGAKGTSACFSRKAFKDNQVPLNSSVAKNLQSYLPTPQSSSLTNNYFGTYTNGNRNWQWMGKIDAKLTEKNRISGEIQEGYSTSLQTGSYLPLPYASIRPGGAGEWQGQVNDTHELSPHLVNLAGIAFYRNTSLYVNPTANGDYPAKAGLTGLAPGQVSTMFPDISFVGNDAPYPWDHGVTGFGEIPYSDLIQDNVQWLKGRHSFTFGGQLLFQFENLALPSQYNQGIQFNGSETANFCPQSGIASDGTACTPGGIDTTTGSPYASYLLGLVDNAGFEDTAVAETGGRWSNYAAYAQDDWKVNSKLMINLGIRYTIPRPFTEAHDRVAFFNPDLPNSEVGGAPGIIQFGGWIPSGCACHTNVKTHYLTFGPRAGFAYSLDPKTVVRASYSMTHFNGGALGGNGEQTGPGDQGFTTDPAFTSPDGGISPAFKFDGGFQNPANGTSYQVPPNFSSFLATGYNTTNPTDMGGYSYDRPDTAGRSPYTEQWALSVERELPSNFVVKLNYAGTGSHFVGLDGGVGSFSNQVDPKYFDLGSLMNAAYDGPTGPNWTAANKVHPGLTAPYANFAGGSIGQALRPFPQYDENGGTWMGPDPWSDLGTASFNALQAVVTHNMKNGLYLLAAYSWSKELDEGGDGIQFFGTDARSAYLWNKERSPGFTDIPQSLSVTEVYDLPIGRGSLVNVQNRILDTIVGGWRLSGLEQYSKGSPLTSITGGCTNNVYAGHHGVIGNGVAGCYADFDSSFSGNIKIAKIGSGTPGKTSYFNPAAFKAPAAYAFGDTPRTLASPSLRNEALLNENLAVSKTFPIFERVKFEFRADAFNLFNRVQFGGITTDITSPSFGVVNGQANGNRVLQMEGYIRF